MVTFRTCFIIKKKSILKSLMGRINVKKHFKNDHYWKKLTGLMHSTYLFILITYSQNRWRLLLWLRLLEGSGRNCCDGTAGWTFLFPHNERHSTPLPLPLGLLANNTCPIHSFKGHILFVCIWNAILHLKSSKA